jgi:tetratricopeptide (TPR) repeat protein
LTDTLARRYTYGNFADLSTIGSEADFFLGIPARQREMLTLAKVQVLEQREATKAIIESNIAGANAICRELGIQTERLEHAIQTGSEAVTTAIGDLGEMIAGELGEIRWELVQLRAVSEQILAVLRQPRSTEARELLNQGIRNLVNDKLEQAEERFNLALRLDNTDYQILMNLSAVELRKGDALRALGFVHDALTLPTNLDTQARADALWHLARIHYAAHDYAKAFQHAQQSTAILSTPRRILQLGVYAILDGNVQEGFSLIARAVRQDPRLFAVAASTPDLASHQPDSFRLLGALSSEALTELQDLLKKLKPTVDGLRDLTAVSARHLDRFRARFETATQSSQEGSYSEWRQAAQTLSTLQVIPDLLRNLNQAAVELTQTQQAESAARQQLAQARLRAEKSQPKGLGCVPWIAAIASGMVAQAFVMQRASTAPQSSQMTFIILVNLAFWGVLAASYLAIGRYQGNCSRLVKSCEASLNGCKIAVETARSKFADAEQSVTAALSKAGC